MSDKSDSRSEPTPLPPGAWGPLHRFARLAGKPLEQFLHIEAASGILLLVAAAVALLWANSPWADIYAHIWHTPIGLRVGSFAFERPLEWFVNDGLMVIFFFVVGLEIRREIHEGELSEWRRAALPAAAAVGGMAAPALVYVAIAGAPVTRSGWGVPMATDIAFAIGVLTLLGPRVPSALRVLLLAVAVIDDLGAILVIAAFYSSGISVMGLLVAGLGVAGILLLQWLGVRVKAAYVVPALVVWAAIYTAGLHPTIAGVVVGLLTPVRAWLGREGFVTGVRRELEQLKNPDEVSSHQFGEALQEVRMARREALSPAESLIESLHPWVAFGIMPIFALANAGVVLTGSALDESSWRVILGVAVALVLGKPLGVMIASWLTLRFKVGTLPQGLNFRHLLVLGTVAGIGFTMSLFIAPLAFADARLLGAAKLGVLLASAVAALLAFGLGRVLLGGKPAPGAARDADEAEASTEL